MLNLPTDFPRFERHGVQLCALCNAAAQPISVEGLMQLCQLQDDEKKMAIWLMEDLTKVRKMTVQLSSDHRMNHAPNQSMPCPYVYFLMDFELKLCHTCGILLLPVRPCAGIPDNGS